MVRSVYLPAETTRPSLLYRIVLVWLVGIVLFLPVKIINFPSNFELVDTWVLAGLPAAWLLILGKPHQKISAGYIIPIWVVMVSSFLSTLTAPSVTNSLIVIVKEIYLFVWFITVTSLLLKIKAGDLRIVLAAWSLMAVLHGLLMIAQFLSPEIWSFTNSLGGNTARVEGYRAAGLFICDKAGCANKAAYYQLLGFAPILLAGFSRRTTVILGIIELVSILITGSMGATLAFLSGLTVCLVSIAVLKKRIFLIIKFMTRLFLALALLGALFYLVTSFNPSYREHFEGIIVGRFDRSSGGRLDLWQRGIDAMVDHRVFLWGIGLENFRIVDPTGNDNQLHNDTLAFLVERGLIGVFGLALFAAIATRRAVSVFLLGNRDPNRARLELIVFLAVIAATAVESLTHQMFRSRELWLILAVLEAVYFYMANPEPESEGNDPKLKEPSTYPHNLVIQNRATKYR